MSRTDGLYNSMQRQVINQMLKLASSDDKAKIVKAFQLAEKITPDQYKGSVRFVARQGQRRPSGAQHRQARRRSSARAARDSFIECLIINTLLRGSTSASNSH